MLRKQFHLRLFWKVWFYFFSLLSLCLFFLYFSLVPYGEKYLTQNLIQTLDQESFLLGQQFGQKHLSEWEHQPLDNLVKSLAKGINNRITLVRDDGVVLSDSHVRFEEQTQIENHGSRPEVLAASKDGVGSAIRTSSTLGEEMLYFARKVQGGFVRLAVPLQSIHHTVYKLKRSLLQLAFLALFLSSLLALVFSRSLVSPFHRLIDVAGRIRKGDLSARLSLSRRDEFGVLSEEINTMASSLESQFHQLKQLEDMRREFVANISHEFKTPLTVILGYAETLENEMHEEHQQKFLRKIEESAHHLKQLVDDILKISECDSGIFELHNVSLQLESFFHELWLQFENQAKLKNVSFLLDIPKKVKVRADKEALRQICSNLLSNALRYSRDGGKISVSASLTKTHCIINVSDTGVGIPKKDLPRIFERFYRVDRARSRELGGTGLGLSIVKHLVHLHDGEVFVESEVEKGTTFTVLFPA